MEDAKLKELKETFFLKEAISCNNHVQPEFFNTGRVKGRTEFEYICSICGADPECSPLVADAVLGTKEGKKFLPICEDCHSSGKKSNLYGKKDQQKAAAVSTGAKRKAKAAATGLGRGRGRGRGHGRGRGRKAPKSVASSSAGGKEGSDESASSDPPEDDDESCEDDESGGAAEDGDDDSEGELRSSFRCSSSELDLSDD